MQSKISIVFLIFFAVACRAQISTDGSVGPAVELHGPDYRIGQALGSRVGDNLFHSFDRFSIRTGESATFSGDAAIRNVVSRVTGGDVSHIDGLLRSEVGQADFYFINPAGIVFGRNASIDVPAAFHAAAASELTFADGGRFSAVDPAGSRLTLATPDSFGFLHDHSGNLSISAQGLEFKPGTHVAFGGRNIDMEGAGIEGEGIDLQLVAVGDQDRNIGIESPPEYAMQGTITMAATHIDVSGNATGRVRFRGGDTTLTDSQLSANTVGDIDPVSDAVVDLRVGRLQMAQGSTVAADAMASGAAGNIAVTGASLTLSDGSSIASSAKASGNAGNVSVSVDDRLAIYKDGSIGSNTYGAGAAGRVEVDAGRVVIDREGSVVDNTGILSRSYGDATGDAGTITLTSRGELSLLNGGNISSSTFAKGKAGSIGVEAAEIVIDGGNQLSDDTGIFSNANENSRQEAGTINVTVDGLVKIANGGTISTDTFAVGKAGEITVKAAEIEIDGGRQIYQTGILSRAFSDSVGNAGSVSVSVDGLLNIRNGGSISTDTSAKGNAGDIVIHADRVVIDRQDS
ncbi:MAG: two-partner secretion domain-containing protein, partial [Gammaproteobacteria bacterium]